MKFTVKKMARIEESTIELKPLTVFIGKNGTNKSYMAHLVYELHKEIKNFEEPSFAKDSKITRNIIANFITEYKESLLLLDSSIVSEEKLSERIQTDVDEYEIEEYYLYTYSIKELHNLDDILNKIYRSVINSLLVKINKSYNTKNNVLEEIKFEYEAENIFSNESIKIRVNEKKFANQKLIRSLFDIVFKFLTRQVDGDDFFYFPSSRTGFVLAFDEIVSGVFRDRFGGRPTATKLTVPTIDFLSNFADIKTGKFQDENDAFSFFNFMDESPKKKIPEEILNYLEKHILKGKILESESEEDYVNYSLKTENDIILDLHLTSTATLELLPLIVFLKHFKSIKNRLLVIEEPEAHLHPKAQILMARFLVLLVNNGAKIVITTHSDYMIKEFNRCIGFNNTKDTIIKEHNLDDGMGNSIYLDESNLAVYLFKEENQKVQLVNLEIEDEFGIPLDSFQVIHEEVGNTTT